MNSIFNRRFTSKLNTLRIGILLRRIGVYTLISINGCIYLPLMHLFLFDRITVYLLDGVEHKIDLEEVENIHAREPCGCRVRIRNGNPQAASLTWFPVTSSIFLS